MIGTAARDRRDERRFARPQIRRNFQSSRRVGGQLAADDHAGLQDLRAHERLAHRVAPSVRCRELAHSVNSATKSTCRNDERSERTRRRALCFLASLTVLVGARRWSSMKSATSGTGRSASQSPLSVPAVDGEVFGTEHRQIAQAVEHTGQRLAASADRNRDSRMGSPASGERNGDFNRTTVGLDTRGRCVIELGLRPVRIC